MKQYKLLKLWLDATNNTLHENVGEILVFEDESRANFLVEKGIIELIADKPEDNKSKDDKPEDPKTKKGNKK